MPGSARSMQGKICLVTGANSGIGLVTARELASQGATVVMVARNAERGETALQAIRAQSGRGEVDLLLADLSSQADVRRLAETVRARYPRLDVLINNAGAMYFRRRETVDGLEMTLAVNYLAPFLLTHLVRDLLTASAPARIVNVSSGAHLSARLHLGDLQSRRRYGPMRAYGQAKLAVVLFTYALARRLAGTGVTANCLHPGFVATNIGQSGLAPPLRAVARLLLARAGVTPEQGARTSIYLAADPAVAGVTGRYFVDCRPQRSAPATYDRALQERLWGASAALVGLGTA